MTPSNLKTGFRLLGGFCVLACLYVFAVLIHGTVTDYQPDPVEDLPLYQDASIKRIDRPELTFLIWNLGYGGLGKESEFYFDANGSQYFSGGKMVHVSKELVEKNNQGIYEFLSTTEADFYLLQEVDLSSKRSYFTNQFAELARRHESYEARFAINYKVGRVPIPIMEPWHAYGRTNSGLATYSRFAAKEASRYQLPGEYGWPVNIFQLDRCVAIHRYPTARQDKELVLMNIHHSAYDEGGALKKQQMAFLKDLLISEYAKGNYVVVGGDWNQCPPGFDYDHFMPGQTEGYTQINIAEDYLAEDWNWAFDPEIPTNRKTHSAYKPGTTFVTLIDFFLTSPNVQVLEVEGYDMGL